MNRDKIEKYIFFFNVQFRNNYNNDNQSMVERRDRERGAVLNYARYAYMMFDVMHPQCIWGNRIDRNDDGIWHVHCGNNDVCISINTIMINFNNDNKRHRTNATK